MNIAALIKKQTDAILRQRSQGPTGSPAVIVRRGDGETKVTTPGTARLDLEAHKISGDHDGRYVRVNRQQFSNKDVITITHNFGQRPVIQVVGGAGNLIYGTGVYGAGVYGGSSKRRVIDPSSIIHDSLNQVTVTLAAKDSGEVIVIG